jgi:cbb3-type cytochrome oxidase maturation protein
MSILVFLVPAALILGLLGLAAFLWSLKSGQYDDLEGAAQRILFDDEPGADKPGDGDPDDDERN